MRYFPAQDPLWIDELHTSWAVADDWQQLNFRSHIGNQSPLYFLPVKVVADQFGNSAESLRAISMLAGISLILITGLIVYRSTGKRVAAVVASSIVAANFDFVFYATEARSYALSQLVFLLQLVCFISILQPTKANSDTQNGSKLTLFKLSMFVLTSIAMFYLHYTTLLVLFAEAASIICLVAVSQKMRKSLLQLLGTMVVVLILSLPGLLHCWEIRSRNYEWTIVSNLQAYLSAQLALVATLIGVPLLGIAISFFANSQQVQSRNKIALIWLPIAACALIPPVFIVACSWLGMADLAQFRFSLCSTSAMCVACGLLVSTIRPNWLVVLVGLVMLGITLTENPIVTDIVRGQKPGSLRNEDWQAAIEFVDNKLQDLQVPVVVYPNLVEDSYFHSNPTDEMKEYYTFPLLGSYSIRENYPELTLIGRPMYSLSNSDLAKIDLAGGCWIVIRSDLDGAQLAGQYADSDLGKFTAKNYKSSVEFSSGHVHAIEVFLMGAE